MRTCLIALLALLAMPAALAAPKVTLNEADFRDRVYACWLGKNIGGTLGMPFEGSRDPHDLTFFTPVPKTPAANDDLDLQILWLKAMEERGTRVNARILGEYWLKYVPVDWNEYGIGKANMRLGFPPPISGQIRNRQWRDSNGAWIRSEIWACVAPGNPALAARYAWEDACVDHGGAEGTYAELFTASLESAAFVERDRDKLLAIGLSYIPADCGVAKAVRAAMDAKARGLDLKAARLEVLKVTEPTGWFQAPRNVAFTMLGWLYGDGDFGKSICAAVNCGDDTDCTGATLGSIFGILHGTKGIPDEWRKPVGTGIQNVAIAGFPAPKTLDELTDKTVAMTRRVLAESGTPVALSADRPTDLSGARGLKLSDPAAAKSLWTRSPYAVYEEAGGLRAMLDFQREPNIAPGASITAKLVIENTARRPVDLSLGWQLPAGLTAKGIPARVRLGLRARRTCDVTLTLDDAAGGIARGVLTLTAQDGTIGTLPFALDSSTAVRKGDVALASRGAKVTSDSELEREKGCTARAIDGVIALGADFEGKRWHSALTPHPHWLAIQLPTAQKIGRIILHFADPGGHPVDFLCEASLDGQTWQTVAEERACSDTQRWEKAIAPTEMRHFRLTIRRSASAQYPDAAQVSEVELIAE